MVASPEQFGPYVVYEQLGSGGMASVHRAETAGHDGFSKSVALKRMLPSIAANADLVQAFAREARIASFMRHSNIPQAYDFGRVGPIYFIAMELVTGRTLRDVLRHCAMTTGPMPVPIALNILNQICDALDYAHNLRDESGQPLGIIHRDVSPSNVIVGETGIVKLIDWGIAKASATGMQTMSGTLKGKYGYMAPEYIEGSIDARADLFALGIIAHELLTNRPLFTVADDYETLTRLRTMEVHPPSKKNPAVPHEIDDIVMTALARNPEQRWQQATALRNALTTVTKRLGLVAPDSAVVAHLDRLFGMPRMKADAPPNESATEVDIPAHGSLQMQIEPVSAPMRKTPSPLGTLVMSGAIAPYPTRPTPTPMPAAFAARETPLPAGTPGPITAQRSIPPAGSGSFTDDAVPTLVRTSQPRMNAVEAPRFETPSLSPSVPPNRQSPISLSPPSRPSGRLDERAGIVRKSTPKVVMPKTFDDERPDALLPVRRSGHASTVLWVLLTAAIIAAATYFLLPRLTE